MIFYATSIRSGGLACTVHSGIMFGINNSHFILFLIVACRRWRPDRLQSLNAFEFRIEGWDLGLLKRLGLRVLNFGFASCFIIGVGKLGKVHFNR